MNCNICPRGCNIDREKSAGCGEKHKIRIAKVMFHHFEEPIISGTKEHGSKGSGAIFFSGCSLRCVYCQNHVISQGGKGRAVSIKKLVKIFKYFERKKANNINLVTPTHFTNEILSALKIYRPKIPVVWNTGGYELPSTIRQLKGYVDIFLTDLKYMDDDLAFRYSGAKNYVENATAALAEMKKIQPKDVVENGLMKRGLIVRHLVLPTHTADSKACLDHISQHLGSDTIVSIMSQYTPCHKAKDYPEIARPLTPLEYKRVVAYAEKLGLKNAYTQSLDSASLAYTPKF